MPYTIRKLPNKRFYRVTNTRTGDIRARRTTKKKAEAQVRLLNSIERKRNRKSIKKRKRY